MDPKEKQAALEAAAVKRLKSTRPVGDKRQTARKDQQRTKSGWMRSWAPKDLLGWASLIRDIEWLSGDELVIYHDQLHRDYGEAPTELTVEIEKAFVAELHYRGLSHPQSDSLSAAGGADAITWPVMSAEEAALYQRPLTLHNGAVQLAQGVGAVGGQDGPLFVDMRDSILSGPITDLLARQIQADLPAGVPVSVLQSDDQIEGDFVRRVDLFDLRLTWAYPNQARIEPHPGLLTKSKGMPSPANTVDPELVARIKSGLPKALHGCELVQMGRIVTKAKWSTAYKNSLPDSAFLYIEPGGKKDSEGKTTPRSLRHFPVRDAAGTVDQAHVQNALSRIPQASISEDAKKKATAAAQKLLKKKAKGETESENGLWIPHPGLVAMRQRCKSFSWIDQGDDKPIFTLGIVLEPNTIDGGNDFERPEAIREACHYWMIHTKGQHSYGHTTEGGYFLSQNESIVVENYVSLCDFDHTMPDGSVEKVKAGSWLTGSYAYGERVKSDIRSGKLQGWSIGCYCRETPVEVEI